jgi:hypothetical protein
LGPDGRVLSWGTGERHEIACLFLIAFETMHGDLSGAQDQLGEKGLAKLRFRR